MNDDDEFLHVNTINRCVRERTKKSLHIYEEMLKKCFCRVKLAVNLGEKSCFYTLPQYVLGKPTYNMKECLKYIYDNIIKYGYYVKFLPPNIFFISWIQAFNSTYKPITNEHVVKTAYQKFLEDTKVTEQHEHQLANQYAITNQNDQHKQLPNTANISLIDNQPNNQSNIQKDNEPSIFNIVPRTGNYSSYNKESEKTEYKPLKFNPEMKNLFK